MNDNSFINRPPRPQRPPIFPAYGRPRGPQTSLNSPRFPRPPPPGARQMFDNFGRPITLFPSRPEQFPGSSLNSSLNGPPPNFPSPGNRKTLLKSDINEDETDFPDADSRRIPDFDEPSANVSNSDRHRTLQKSNKLNFPEVQRSFQNTDSRITLSKSSLGEPVSNYPEFPSSDNRNNSSKTNFYDTSLNYNESFSRPTYKNNNFKSNLDESPTNYTESLRRSADEKNSLRLGFNEPPHSGQRFHSQQNFSDREQTSSPMQQHKHHVYDNTSNFARESSKDYGWTSNRNCSPTEFNLNYENVSYSESEKSHDNLISERHLEKYRKEEPDMSLDSSVTGSETMSENLISSVKRNIETVKDADSLVTKLQLLQEAFKQLPKQEQEFLKHRIPSVVQTIENVNENSPVAPNIFEDEGVRNLLQEISYQKTDTNASETYINVKQPLFNVNKSLFGGDYPKLDTEQPTVQTLPGLGLCTEQRPESYENPVSKGWINEQYNFSRDSVKPTEILLLGNGNRSDSVASSSQYQDFNRQREQWNSNQDLLPLLNTCDASDLNKMVDVATEASSTSLVSNESRPDSEWSRGSSIPFFGETVNTEPPGIGIPNQVKEAFNTEVGIPKEKRSTLEDALEQLEISDPIVGLDFITENQRSVSVSGSFPFKCQLCKTSVSRSSIIDHVVGTKHRLAYIKDVDKTFYDVLISKCLLGNDTVKKKDAVLSGVILKFEKKYGRGHVVVENIPVPEPKKVFKREENESTVTPLTLSDIETITEHSDVSLHTSVDVSTSFSEKTKKLEISAAAKNDIPVSKLEIDGTPSDAYGSQNVEVSHYAEIRDNHSLKRPASPSDTSVQKVIKTEFASDVYISDCNSTPTQKQEHLRSENNFAGKDTASDVKSNSYNKFDPNIFEQLSKCTISTDEEAALVLKTLDTLTRVLLLYKLHSHDRSQTESMLNSIRDGTGSIDPLLALLSNENPQEQCDSLESNVEACNSDFTSTPAPAVVPQPFTYQPRPPSLEPFTETKKQPPVPPPERQPANTLQPPPFFLQPTPKCEVTTTLATPTTMSWSNMYRGPPMYGMPYYQPTFMQFPGMMFPGGGQPPPPPPPQRGSVAPPPPPPPPPPSAY